MTGKTIKHNLMIFTLFICCLLCLCGCTVEEDANETFYTDDNGTYINNAYAPKGLVTIGGDAFVYEKAFIDKEMGFGINFPEAMIDISNRGKFVYSSISPYGLHFLFSAQKGLEIANTADDTMSELELDQIRIEVNKYVFTFAGIFRIPAAENDENASLMMNMLETTYDNLELIAVVGTDSYYFGYNDDYSAIPELTEIDQTDLDSLFAVRDEFKETLAIFALNNNEGVS